VKRTLLIINSLSGSATTVELDTITTCLQEAGLAVEQVVKLPDDQIPDRTQLKKRGIQVVVAVSGDGTVAGLSDMLGNWSGDVLVLPGGTMNLLSRRLHGDLALADILERLPSARLDADHIPVIQFGKRQILTGLTVGPSTRWGEVREGIRQGDVESLTYAVPEAWSETLSDKGVWLEGHPREAYAGIFVEPEDAGALSVIAFRANGIADMLGHGVAWLRRDFRDGPSDDFGAMEKVRIVGDDSDTGLLIDGEYEDGKLPLSCNAGLSSLKFMRIVEK
jgi:Diacylglycerol kinase catalytic domain